MFKLVRYFSILSAVAIAILTALLLNLYNRHATENLTALTGVHNAVLTQSLLNAIWPDHGGHLTEVGEVDGAWLRAQPGTRRLHETLLRLTADLPVVKISYHRADGRTLYSTEAAAIGRNDSLNPNLRRVVKFGVPRSKLSHVDAFASFSGSTDKVSVVETYAPVKDSSDKVVGVLELRHDVSREIAAIRQDMWSIAAIIVVAFTLLYLVLLTIVRHAGRELKRQYEGLSAAKRRADAAARDAEHANRAKSEFLAVMSHEIRTPLNGILGMSSLLLDGRLDDEHRGFARIIQTSGANLLEIINDVLDIAKIESGAFRLDIAPFRLGATVEGTVELLSGKAGEKGIELGCRVDPSLPELCSGDGLRLRQVLLNLVGNAVKFTEAGSIEVAAEVVDSAADWADVRLSVSDTGVGIDPDLAPTLFEPFVQADSSTTRQFGGTGLGLAICRDLVALMGGRISVDSAVGEGSRFIVDVRLPTLDAWDGAPVTSKPQRDLTGQRVLIVDSHRVNRSILHFYVERAGGEALAVERCEAGLSALADATFDIAIVGFGVSGMSGLEFAERVRAAELETPPRMVVLAAASEIGSHAQSHKIGFDACIVKPVRLSAFRDAMTYLFERPGHDLPSAGAEAGHARLAHGRANGRVLLAEDNPNNQLLFRKVLERSSIAVDIAANGAEAIEMFAGRDYALVLMDVRMPHVNGLVAAAEIRKTRRGAETPIVALTAGVMGEDRAACAAAGMCDFIAKPIAPLDLIETIEKWLGEPVRESAPARLSG